MSCEITLLAENSVRRPGLLAEHGLAWWIEICGKSVLFDTGQGMVIGHNAKKLGIKLERADALVLSHGHYDHTGGIGSLLSTNTSCPIWMHPASMEKKFSGTSPSEVRCISTSLLHDEKLRSHTNRLRDASFHSEVVPGLFLTGEIPRLNGFEDTGGQFFLDAGCSITDPLADDIAVYFENGDSIIVLLGCAHSGVMNTISFIAKLTGKQIGVVMGGMHLEKASAERLSKTIEGLRGMGVREIYPCHCTGHDASIALQNALPSMVRQCSVGSKWVFA